MNLGSSCSVFISTEPNIFQVDLVDILNLFGVYSHIRHQVSIIKDREMKKIEEGEGKDEERKQKLRDNIKVHKYIGETARSVYERTREHLSDMQQLKKAIS